MPRWPISNLHARNVSESLPRDNDFGNGQKDKTEHTKLSYIGNTILKTRQHNGDMVPLCCEMLGLEPDTPLQMYEEIRQSMVEPLDPMRTLAKSELQTGDIVVFQFPVKDPYMYQLATAKEYFSYLTNRIDVIVHKLEDPKGEGI